MNNEIKCASGIVARLSLCDEISGMDIYDIILKGNEKIIYKGLSIIRVDEILLHNPNDNKDYFGSIILYENQLSSDMTIINDEIHIHTICKRNPYGKLFDVVVKEK